jgi:hypothetical protein
MSYEPWIRQKKWGFVIYRCTYKDDAAWSNFMRIFKDMILGGIVPLSESLNQDVIDRLAFDVREDRALFQKATRPELRDDFLAWARSDQINEELSDEELRERAERKPLSPSSEDIQSKYVDSPRYEYFLVVDEEAMNSVLAVEHRVYDQDSWVYIVNADWDMNATFDQLNPGWFGHNQEELSKWDGGATARVNPNDLYPSLFQILWEADGAWWSELYQPPPTILEV